MALKTIKAVGIGVAVTVSRLACTTHAGFTRATRAALRSANSRPNTAPGHRPWLLNIRMSAALLKASLVRTIAMPSGMTTRRASENGSDTEGSGSVMKKLFTERYGDAAPPAASRRATHD